MNLIVLTRQWTLSGCIAFASSLSSLAVCLGVDQDRFATNQWTLQATTTKKCPRLYGLHVPLESVDQGRGLSIRRFKRATFTKYQHDAHVGKNDAQ